MSSESEKSLPPGAQDLLRFLRDFIPHHLSALRRQAAGNGPGPENVDLPELAQADPDALFTSAPWHMDSLELVTLAGMVSDSFFLNETGLEDLLLAKPSLGCWASILERSLGYYSERISFFTSGSTGMPKRVEHRLAVLRQEMGEMGRLIREALAEAGQTPLRHLSLVPSHHIYGFLFTILLPDYLGCSDREVRRVSPLFTRFLPGDVIIAIPDVIRSWKNRDIKLPAGSIVVSSTAPLPEEHALWIRTTGASFLEVYGSSETSGIATRSLPGHAFSLLPFWERRGESLGRRDEPGSIPLPDRVEWSGPDLLRPVGRKDSAVQIQGVNVFPLAIAERFVKSGLLAEAALRSYESPSGTRLKLFGVPQPGPGEPLAAAELEQSLRAWAAANLAPQEIPSSFTFGPALPRNSMGKLSDWETADLP